MAGVAAGLGVLFAAGFAVQRLIEICDGIFDFALKKDPTRKKFWTAFVATLVGCLISALGKLDVVGAVAGGGPTLDLNADWYVTTAHVLVTGLAIGGGTDGINSVLKYANYAKQDRARAVAPRKAPPTLAEARKAAQLGVGVHG